MSPYLTASGRPSPSSYARATPSSSPSDGEDDGDVISSKAMSTPHLQRRRGRPVIQVPLMMVFPKSDYVGWIPPLPVSHERDVWSEYSFQNRPKHVTAESGPDPPTIVLDKFSIYKPDCGSQRKEFAPLHHLRVKLTSDTFLFDGILIVNDAKFYVQRVPFSRVSIGGYCDTSQHHVGDQLWIQSAQCDGTDLWYQLRDPAPEYARYHLSFLWIANFAKYFIDYLWQERRQVYLRDFRFRFHRKLEALHAKSPLYRKWATAYRDSDFRRAVAAYHDFLYKEAVDIAPKNADQPIWEEVCPRLLAAVEAQESRETMTVVTPYVYKCFRRMMWGGYLTVRRPPFQRQCGEGRVAPHGAPITSATTTALATVSARSATPASHGSCFSQSSKTSRPNAAQTRPAAQDSAEDQMDLAARASLARSRLVGVVLATPTRLPRNEHGELLCGRPRSIRVGDVVGVERDAVTVWKSEHQMWFAYVQGIHVRSSGRRLLSIIWLYAPSDTTCSRMHYPHHNELFFSNHCNCGDDVLDAADVICKVPVALFSGPGETGAEYFVRQTYLTDEAAFVTLKRAHLTCHHLSAESESGSESYVESDVESDSGSDGFDVCKTCRLGDTVLYQPRGKALLEPAEIVGLLPKDDSVLVRRLPRRALEFPDAGIKPNELVYTEETFKLRRRQIRRRCNIRFFTEEERKAGQIPPPYDRNGTANSFYITCRLNKAMARLEPLARPFPASLRQAFDPSAPPPRRPLRGMDLYCGGGNFGRGLEEGGAVRNKWAVDYDRDAIQTYHANLANPEDTALYFGSVNDLLADAINGQYSGLVPRPGEVDFISAGSPCQGFSNANQKRLNERSLRNSSLVASVAAFIDFYRPKYALLENVINMASSSTKSRDENVFSQLLCSLVGLGYQVQQFNLDAWSFGNPQSRSRLFVSIAAPGLKLPPHPSLSHSHPPGKGDRALGVAANGLKFGQRRFEATPFKFVTAAESAAHLPWIGDGRTQTCISHPDHRLSRNETNLKRILLTQIPYVPRMSSFITAYHAGRLASPLIDGYCWENRHKARDAAKSWQRVNPDGLMPTITTAAQPSCSFTGQSLHWADPRLLSVEEARIAQGFPEQDVLIGYPRTQWKIVGNSVARGVALALGMSLREAWLDNELDSDEAGAFATENVHQEACHSPLSAVSEAASSPLEVYTSANRSHGSLDSGVVASVAAGELADKTPEIPAIVEMATPADSPSKRPYIIDDDDDDARPTKMARIAIEAPPPPRLSFSSQPLPTPSPDSATVAAASPGSPEAADAEAGSAAVFCLRENLKRLYPASQADETNPRPAKMRRTRDTDEAAQAGDSPLLAADRTAPTTAATAEGLAAVEGQAGLNFAQISDWRANVQASAPQVINLTCDADDPVFIPDSPLPSQPASPLFLPQEPTPAGSRAAPIDISDGEDGDAQSGVSMAISLSDHAE